MHARTPALAAAALLLGLLAGCGGDDDADSAATTTSPPTTTTTPPPSPPPPPPTPPPSTTKPEPQVETIRIVVRGGRPVGGIKRPTVQKGEKVVIVVVSDAGESVHLHGYDVDRPVTPGKPTRIAFTASIPGRFEVELHDPTAVLAELTVAA